jgi:hypothetical protein
VGETTDAGQVHDAAAGHTAAGDGTPQDAAQAAAIPRPQGHLDDAGNVVLPYSSDAIEPFHHLPEGVYTGPQAKRMVEQRADTLGMTFEQAAHAAEHGTLPPGEVGEEIADLLRCLEFPVAGREPVRSHRRPAT